MDAQRPAEPGTHPTRCIVWHAADAPVPPKLAEALRRPGLTVESCTDPFMALALACGEAPAGASTVIVLVRPQTLDDPAGLLRAAETYAPAARFWRFDPAAAESLKAVTLGDLEAPSPVVVAHRNGPPARPSPRPSLRLAGEGTLPDAQAAPEEVREEPAPGDGAPPPESLRQVLSPEELAMLLSEDIVDIEHRPRARAPDARSGDPS